MLPPDHPSIATSLHAIGSVHKAQGKPEEALAKMEEALAMLRRVLPADHPSPLHRDEGVASSRHLCRLISSRIITG